MIYQSVLISIFVLAEPSREEQGVTYMVPQKFRDRNFSTFQTVARNGQLKRFSKYGQYIYQIAENMICCD